MDKEEIIVNVEEAEKEEKELEIAITGFIRRWVSRITFSIMGVVGVAIIMDKFDTPEPGKPIIGWKGLDSSKEAYEVKHWDMVTHEIEYYEFNPSSVPSQIKTKPSRVEIRMNESQKVILEGITQEEVLEGFDIDYENMRDYFGGDELR